MDGNNGYDTSSYVEGQSTLTVHLSTDAGLLALITPGRLEHRQGDHSWWTDEDNILDEANAGNIVPIETGAEGGYAVRVTFEELGEREQQLSAQSADFWLNVPDDEEVAVVAGEELSFPDTPGAATFWAASGPYHVTVTRLRWTEEPDDEAGDALPDYVVILRPLGSGERPPTLEYVPNLTADR